MCMEDVRLGRQIQVSEVQVTVATTVTPLVGDDPDRVMLMIGIPVSGNFFCSTRHDLALNEGFRLVSTALAFFVFDIKTHGQMVTKAWYGIHSVGGVGVAVIEGRLPIR
jgi:hypothetical protein